MKLLSFCSAALAAAAFLGGCAAKQPQIVQVVQPVQPQYQNLFQNPDPNPPNSRAKNIVVPNKETAIRIAKAVWAPVYGEKSVQAAQGFEAALSDGVWSVTARFPQGSILEGTALMDISQEDARVLRIRHGKFQPGSEWR